MLYIIATPIGNIQDTSFRAVKTLLNSDIILSEDTRSPGLFLKRIKELFPNLDLGNKPQLISYYKEKEMEKLPQIINILKQNKTISLISQSGLPLISDPGYLLIKILIKENLDFTVIPGPSAFTTAVIHSGFPTKNILFLSFLPKKKSALIQLIKKIEQTAKNFKSLTIVFYESPFRINKTLKILSDYLPNTEISICREMTKKFEEIKRGQAKELINQKYKGEITITVKI